MGCVTTYGLQGRAKQVQPFNEGVVLYTSRLNIGTNSESFGVMSRLSDVWRGVHFTNQ